MFQYLHRGTTALAYLYKQLGMLPWVMLIDDYFSLLKVLLVFNAYLKICYEYIANT